MLRDESLARAQLGFFAALGASGEPPGLRGRFEIYRFAYFERIRASIEEDYPLLFEYLEGLEDVPTELDAEGVTRDLLTRNHPGSWTLAEASLPVIHSVEALLDGDRWAATRAEARRLAALDEAESLAGWLAEWPEPELEKSRRVEAFATGHLHLVRTKTWREAGDRTFWRSDLGVRSEISDHFQRFTEFQAWIAAPTSYADFLARATRNGESDLVSEFLRCGISEGWLRFVAP